MLDLPPRDGVLAVQHLREAIRSEVIIGQSEIPDSNLQPASLDLRLGSLAYPLRCSFLPGRRPVEEKLRDYRMEHQPPVDLDEGGVLEKGRPYLIPLCESLRLPGNIRGRANPKSSTGRVDVFTRVITDGGARFDEIRAGYGGGLYLEVVPLSFSVRVRSGLALNQLRLFVGSPELSDADVREAHKESPLVFLDGLALSGEELPLDRGLFLGLDIRGAPRARRVGYRARKHVTPLDLTSPEPADVSTYWEEVEREGPRAQGRIVLDPKSFYLLLSHESVSIPGSLAAEMVAYDPTSGELRTHYAGFFDPGFGSGPGVPTGSRAALEVRAHDVAFVIEHGQPVCKLTFENMLEPPDRLYGSEAGSSYQGQEGVLSKHFKRAGTLTEPPQKLEGQLSLIADSDA